MDPARPWKTVKTREGKWGGSALAPSKKLSRKSKPEWIRTCWFPPTFWNGLLGDSGAFYLPPFSACLIQLASPPPHTPLSCQSRTTVYPGRALSPPDASETQTHVLETVSLKTSYGDHVSKQGRLLGLSLPEWTPRLREQRTDQSMRRHWLRELCCSSLI